MFTPWRKSGKQYDISSLIDSTNTKKHRIKFNKKEIREICGNPRETVVSEASALQGHFFEKKKTNICEFCCIWRDR